MSDIDLVLFDFGGVFTNSPLAAFRAVGPELGIDPDELFELVLGPMHVDTDHPWHQVERGELSLKHASVLIRELSASRGLDIEPFSVLSRVTHDSGKRDEMVERVRAIRSAGVRVGMITNNLREYGARWRSMIPVDELFDHVVDSCEVGLRKPDPRIYELALSRFPGATPAGTAFLDDLPSNIAGAEAVGMVGVLVEDDQSSAIRWLEDLAQRRQDGRK